MTDLERFFVQLVKALNAVDSALLRQPIALEDIMRDVLPYRTHRRALQIDSSEEYELVLMRLAAGEGGYMVTDPPEAMARFQAEIATPHPDLAIIDDDEGVTVLLEPSRVAAALVADGAETSSYAPPPPPPPPAPPRPPASDPDDALPLDEVRSARPVSRPLRPAERDADPEAESVTAREHCSYCGGGLPDGRIVNFCPHCGQGQALTRCPECRSEVEIGWRHCITCGYDLGG